MIDTSLIKFYEGLYLKAYLCPANVWTIGWGSTRHMDGRPVKQGEQITQYDADLYLQNEVNKRLAEMKLPDTLNDNQKSALLSFQFNLGQSAWLKSTLRKKVLANPSDVTIRDEFMKWNKAGGKVLNGLTKRRDAEAKLYFS